jgi:cell division protease FtsH
MVDEEGQSLGEFGASFKGFLDQMAAQAPAEEPIFLTRLRAHFSAEPTTFPIVGEEFESSDYPNVQRALESYVQERDCSTELVGITGDHMLRLSANCCARLHSSPPTK